MKKLTQAEIEIIRKKKIAQIKIAQSQLNLEDDIYRALLTRVTGKSSAAKLNLKELDQVIDELVKQGFVMKSKTKQRKPKPRKELTAMISKIEALLLDNNLPWNYAHAIAKRQFGVDKLEWLTYEQCHSVVAALQIYADRQKKKKEA